MSKGNRLMTFEEAMYYSLKVPWMVEPCTNIDIDSWCVGVVPVDKIIYNTGLELEIIPFGSIDPILAQHIVNIHNNKIEQNKIVSDSMTKILQENHIKDYGISQ